MEHYLFWFSLFEHEGIFVLFNGICPGWLPNKEEGAKEGGVWTGLKKVTSRTKEAPFLNPLESASLCKGQMRSEEAVKGKTKTIKLLRHKQIIIMIQNIISVH